eukprot:m.370075 g.370075  ORF g.370075 m.370075 type:complete len:95 (-) comp52081_c0_seq1:3-287(-)
MPLACLPLLFNYLFLHDLEFTKHSSSTVAGSWYAISKDHLAVVAQTRSNEITQDSCLHTSPHTAPSLIHLSLSFTDMLCLWKPRSCYDVKLLVA